MKRARYGKALLRTTMVGTLVLTIWAAAGLTGCSSEKSDSDGSSADATDTDDTSDPASTDGVEWTDESFADALARAKDTGKMVLVDVWSDHCAQCGIMDEEVWATPEGIELVGDAIPVKIPSDAPESYAFRNKYPITGLPAVLLLGSDGNEINRVVGYQNRSQFLSEAYKMMEGIDPLPELKAAADANPQNAAVYIPLLEMYLNRTNEREATKTKDRILELDPTNAGGHAEKALREMARYYAFFHMDSKAASDIYRSMVESYPNANSITGALKATLDEAKKTGQVDEWKSWICAQAERNADNGRFNSAVAMYAFRNKVTGACLAEAATRAIGLGAGPAGIDTVAVALAAGS